MIASLPMYDRSEVVPATDRFWQLIREQLAERGIKSPDRLDRSPDIHSAWYREDLLLSQTCSLPFRRFLAGRVTLVGTPDPGIDGCDPGYYHSVYVSRATDGRQRIAEFSGAAIAYNEAISQSGWAAPLEDFRRLGLIVGSFRKTGSHERSAAAVAAGQADFAALDAHSWRLIRRFCDFAEGLKVVGATRCTPGLPMITARKELAGQLFEAVKTATARLSPSDRDLLPFRDFVKIPESLYLALPDAPPAPD